jgi:hypothetical protein
MQRGIVKAGNPPSAPVGTVHPVPRFLGTLGNPELAFVLQTRVGKNSAVLSSLHNFSSVKCWIVLAIDCACSFTGDIRPPVATGKEWCTAVPLQGEPCGV